MSESHALFRMSIDAIGVAKVSAALAISTKHAYRLSLPPMSEDHPDGQGARNDVDRVEMLIDVLAAHPNARPVLHLWRLHFDQIFARALGREAPSPLTVDRLATKAGAATREFSEFLGQCCADGFDRERLVAEGMEAIAAIERLVRAAEAGMQR